MGSFYDQRRGVAPVRPTAATTDHEWLDSADFASRHVRRRQDGLATIRWRIVGVHCGACVWLLERLPRLEVAIRIARLDLAAGALDLLVDAQILPPSRQAALVASLGYRLEPWLDRDAGVRQQVARARLVRVAVALASALGAMHVTMNVIAGGMTGDLDAASRQFYGWLSLILAAPALTWCAMPFWRGVRAAIVLRQITLDATVAAVLVVTLAAGVRNLFRGSGDLYFDAGALFVALLLTGRAVFAAVHGSVIQRAATQSALVPDHAWREVDGQCDVIASGRLQIGDLVIVKPGAIVPADGTIQGTALISAAVLTGEARTLHLADGAKVYAGCRSLADGCRLVVSAVGEATRVGGLLHAAAGALILPRAPEAIDRMQAWFAPLLAGLSAISGLVWWHVAPERALDQAVAMILVCCPCALGLAAPLAATLATLLAAQRGVLVRDAAALDLLARPRQIVFDKTGTVTKGEPTVTASTLLEARYLPGVLAMAETSSHPAAQAVARFLRARAIAPSAVSPVEEIPGRGLRMIAEDGVVWLVGSAAHCGVADPGGLASVVLASVAGRVVFQADIADALQAGAHELVADLHRAGVPCHLCSGDRLAAVGATAESLGISASRMYAAQSPEQKADRLRTLRAEGPVVMVGDGLNDAGALAEADVAIGMRGGLAACLERCAVVVIEGRIADLARLFILARRYRSSVRCCLGLALAYNMIGVALVLGGAIGPLVCAVAMPVSSLSVLCVAWWMMRDR